MTMYGLQITYSDKDTFWACIRGQKISGKEAKLIFQQYKDNGVDAETYQIKNTTSNQDLVDYIEKSMANELLYK